MFGCLGDVGLGLNARERASGESGDLGEPCGDFAPWMGKCDFEGDRESDRRILFISEKPSR